MSRQKVFVGLSGGVDSAVAAALLLEQGYDVTGVFIKIWQPAFTRCAWKEDRLDAMRVAVALGIPFRTIDLSAEYERDVTARMISEYARGITPNPDILCNRFIKFGAFRKWARAEGADLIATGHHAQIKKTERGFELIRGADPGKDQAYFLSELSQDDLGAALLPIGHMQKSEVRAEAARRGLPSASRPDSQGLCFVGDIDMHDFLRELLHPVPGKVRSADGRVIGTHDGAALYTIGQRHAFAITEPADRARPAYVVAIDARANSITVAPDIGGAMRTDVSIDEAHWISGEAPRPGIYQAEVRYHQKPQRIELLETGASTAQFKFSEPQLAVPGQSLVLYEGDVCRGGGIILPSIAH